MSGLPPPAGRHNFTLPPPNSGYQQRPMYNYQPRNNMPRPRLGFNSQMIPPMGQAMPINNIQPPIRMAPVLAPVLAPPIQELKIKVGWFAENSLTIPDVGIAFESVCNPGNLMRVEVGKFDALLTVRTLDDISKIRKILTNKGVKIKDQMLKEFLVLESGLPVNPVQEIKSPVPLQKDKFKVGRDYNDENKSIDKNEKYNRSRTSSKSDKKDDKKRDDKNVDSGVEKDEIIFEKLSANTVLTTNVLKSEIEKREKLLTKIKEKCDPMVSTVHEMFPMKEEHDKLVSRRATLSRKYEAYIISLDKAAEPYMSWLCKELEKKSTDLMKFRTKGIKCFDTPLAAEDSYSRSLFDEGSLMVIRVNSINEQKRSVTVHLRMNELNQIHKNMQVRDALQMIQDQWKIYVQHLVSVRSKSLMPPAHVTTTLKWLSEGKNLKLSQYDAVLSYILERRESKMKELGVDPEMNQHPMLNKSKKDNDVATKDILATLSMIKATKPENNVIDQQNTQKLMKDLLGKSASINRPNQNSFGNLPPPITLN